jgi:hypothetical protein
MAACRTVSLRGAAAAVGTVTCDNCCTDQCWHCAMAACRTVSLRGAAAVGTVPCDNCCTATADSSRRPWTATHSWQCDTEVQKFWGRVLQWGVGRDSSVGIATRYGLDGPGIESRWGEIFRIRPDRPSGPPSLLYNGYLVFPGGKEAGAWCWPPTLI